jgi:two-component system nitrate/nitrite response regulator NarL
MMQGGRQLTIAAADTQPLYLEGLRSALAGAPGIERVITLPTAYELAGCLRDAHVDVDVVGVAPTAPSEAWLAAVGSPDRVSELLVLIDVLDSETLSAWVRIGARGLASRAVAASELVAAVRGVAAGATYLGAHAQDIVLGEMRRLTALGQSILTRRELDVLRELADGKSTAAIGASLFLGHNTVKTHLQHVYEKVGVSNRAGAVREAMRRGLLT